MRENDESHRAKEPRMETNIVFESPRKSIGQTIVTGFLETAAALAAIALLGWLFLNCTPAGEELMDKYERKSRETVEALDDGVKFCRFYASYTGHPPSSGDEVVNFQVERMSNPFRQYHLPTGEILPYWNAKDGFGHDIDIQVNPQTRRIKLTSPGFLPLSGEKPGIFNVTRETTY